MRGLLIPLLAFQILQPVPKWGIEVQGTNEFHPISTPAGAISGALIKKFVLLPGGRADVTAIGLKLQEEGSAVRVDVSAVTGPPGSAYSLDLPQEAAGTYAVVPPGEIVAEGLRRFGIEPIRLRVVPNKPAVPAKVEIVNNSGSVAVEAVEETRLTFEVTLRNTGSRRVGSLITSLLTDGGNMNNNVSVLPMDALIEPGGRYQTSLDKPGSGAAGAARLTVTAVAFTDGTFEGEGDEIVIHAARHLGSAIQLRKMFAAVESAFESGRPPKDIAELSAVAMNVPPETDTSALSDLLARAPQFRDSWRNLARKAFLDGIRSGAQAFVSVRERARGQDGTIPLRDWWMRIRDTYLFGPQPR